MDYKQIIHKLDDIKTQLKVLQDIHHKEGTDKYYKLRQTVEMIIRRTYPNPKEVEAKLFSLFSVSWTAKTDGEIQQEYIDDLQELGNAIDTIKEEYELFGFMDFSPVKEKSENTLRLGLSPKNNYWERKRSK